VINEGKKRKKKKRRRIKKKKQFWSLGLGVVTNSQCDLKSDQSLLPRASTKKK